MSMRVRVVAGAVAGLIAVAAARADTAQPAPAPMPIVGLGMTMPEYQGLGCMLGGTTAGAGAFAYSDIITAAATGMVNPVLLLPVVATGFAVGCSVGAAASPLFLWIHRALGG